jgi:uncharacterized protein (DUF697 family)
LPTTAEGIDVTSVAADASFEAGTRRDVPVIWLVGKSGAGKSSIAAVLAGAPTEIVGQGFSPTTAHSTMHAYPAQDPVLQFLDTRGLEDGGPDNSGEVAAAIGAAVLVLVAVRAGDRSIAATLQAVRAARRRRPGIPVIVAQTWLHDLYGDGDRHVLPYPFDGTNRDFDRPGVAPDVGAALSAQRASFARAVGPPAPRFVPVDFTRSDDGIEPPDYGADALWRVIAEAAPAVAAAVRGPSEAAIRVQIMLPWATAAAAADGAPIPILGGVGAAGVQAGMIRAIARRFGLEADRAMIAEFAAVLGARFALGYAAKSFTRQVLKLAPLWGGLAVGAWSFAVTWGLGEAAVAFCRAKSRGETPDRAAVARAYEDGLRRGRNLALTRARDVGADGPAPPLPGGPGRDR